LVGNADLVEVQRLQAEAWLAHAAKRDANAVKLMKSAIALEESTSATWIAAPLLAGNEQLGDLEVERNTSRPSTEYPPVRRLFPRQRTEDAQIQGASAGGSSPSKDS
jgi:hypothetical protein